MRSPARVWLDLPMARKALIVIAIPVLPLLITAALYTLSAAVSARVRANTERAGQNQVELAEVHGLVIEAESTVRGYLLGENPALLVRHRDVRGEIVSHLAHLDDQTTDARQRALLPRLRELVTARLDALDAVMRSHETTGLNSPEMMVHVERGADAMGALIAHVQAMQDNQSRLLAARAERLRLAQERSSTIVLAGAATGVIGGLTAALLFTTGITRRLGLATQNMSRLSDQKPLVSIPPAADEIGGLTADMERAARLLVERDQQLRQRMQELEGLTRELEAFSYSVSHDLRAPLRHVAGFASMLEKSGGETLTDQQRRYTRTIVKAAAQMGRLIDDLLAFSRTSRGELREVAVDVSAIVHDVQQQLADDVNGRDVRWLVGPLPRVTGDPAMLRVVFDNLLSNALKYTRPRQPATIEIGGRTGDGGEAVIYVRDNGVGFDMRYHDKLFGVFQRLHRSDEFEGTGIGLATVRRIVSRHGGRTWAEGRPGDGATFYIALPTLETDA